MHARAQVLIAQMGRLCASRITGLLLGRWGRQATRSRWREAVGGAGMKIGAMIRGQLVRDAVRQPTVIEACRGSLYEA